MKSNIVLIGMPGCGKSTLGVVLAKNLGMGFVDTDLVIQQKAGKRLHELITEMGDKGFIDYEGEVNSEVDGTDLVIATGGSAVYSEKAMEHLKEIGVIVYLRTPYHELSKRLVNLDERGVVSYGKVEIKEIFADRRTLYEKYAEVVIDEDGKSIPELIEILKPKLSGLLEK